MKTNHQAHGPVSLDRLHQIREILSKASAQSDGGNLGYAMADAVKVIDGSIASSSMEPYGYVHKGIYENNGSSGLSNDHEAYRNSRTHIPLYTAPPAPVVPDECAIFDAAIDKYRTSEAIDEHAWNHGVLVVMAKFRECRAAMLQAGNSPATPDGWQLVPKEPTEAMNKAGWAAMNEHDAINPTYRAMLAAAPQQEVNP
ncbi:TPA: hypothetical protein G8N49_003946 [Salmonella enterica]|nr:hypothetical protein [Salmonella enterica]HAK5321166.1 hypothetical protein [Salmonella enterica]